METFTLNPGRSLAKESKLASPNFTMVNKIGKPNHSGTNNSESKFVPPVDIPSAVIDASPNKLGERISDSLKNPPRNIDPI